MKKHRFAASYALALVLIVSVALFGCSSGGGDSTPSTGSTNTLTLSVVSTTPLNKISGIAIQSAIAAVFSKAVETTSINEDTFIVTGATGTVTGTVVYDATGRTATFTPSAPFAKIKTYTATVTTGVKDADGNALAANYIWSFTTGPVADAGYEHTIVLKSDGTIWAWGLNDMGQCDPAHYVANDPNRLRSPVQVTLPGPAVVSVAAGGYHTLAIRSDGTVVAWGQNNHGQLGDGSHLTAHGLDPVQAQNLTGAIAVAAGTNHSLALKSDGTVWAWGHNTTGELGNGTFDSQYVPIQVNALSGITAISAGDYFSLALKSDGTVWAWGENQWGQLGDGNGGASNIRSNVPVQVSGLTAVTAISAGYDHALALKSDGTVWAWGANGVYQCGVDNNRSAEVTPVQATSVSGINAIAAGHRFSLALKNDGTAVAWGTNYYGTLGNDNTGVNSLMPVQTLISAPVAALAGGRYHSVALKSDGTLFTWGDNANGQLGYATNNNDPSKVPAAVGVF